MAKNNLIQKSKEKLEELDQKIVELKSQYNLVKEESKREYQQNIDKLEAKKNEWQNKLNEAAVVSEEQWDEVKETFKESSEAIKQEINETFTKLKATLK
jgi:BMFP domain-containing protein YqiC